MLLAGVGRDQAGVDGETLGADQPFSHAARDDGLEQIPQDVALTKTPMPVLRKGRMIGNFAIQPEATKPTIGEIEMNLFAQAALGTDAHAIADEQHADHQLGIDRRPAGVAVKRLQPVPNVFKVKMPVDSPELMVGGHVVIETEIVKQPGRRRLNAHHRRIPRQISRRSESRPRRPINGRVFQHNRPFAVSARLGSAPIPQN